MEQILTQLLMVASVIAPIVTALLEVAKKTFSLPKNYLPLIAMILGIFVGFLVSISFELEVSTAHLLWAGGLAGLTSVGLFELGNKRVGTTK